MRYRTLAVIAAAFMACAPAHAVEIDCPPELTARAEGVVLDEDLKEKRKKARAEELARAKARFMQHVRSVTPPAEPVPALLTPAQ